MPTVRFDGGHSNPGPQQLIEMDCYGFGDTAGGIRRSAQQWTR